MFAKIISRITLAAFALTSTVALVFADPATTLIPASGDLVEKFRTGKFELYDLPAYIIYLIDFLIYIAGGIAVLFVVIGGYKYMIGGMVDDKEAGKKTIAFALTGFAVSVLAWVIVNFVQVWLTSS
ncbi:MAG: pilin [Patescibacteria group bacterium]